MRSCSFCGDNQDGPLAACLTCGYKSGTDEDAYLEKLESLPPLDHLAYLDPEFLASALTVENGLRHPDWKAIFAHLDQQEGLASKFEVWNELVHWWLTMLAEDLGGDYRIYQEADCWLLSDRPAPMTGWLLGGIRDSQTKLRQWFGPVFDQMGQSTLVVLHFGYLDDFYGYTQHFFPESDHGVGAYGGTMLNHGYPHVALPHRALAQTSNTLAHELCHLAFCQWDLPRWLDEGLATIFENIDVLSAFRSGLTEHSADHQAYWTEDSIQHFWSGTAFFFSDEGQRLSYSLASLLTLRLMDDADRFPDFLLEARQIDSGQTASLDLYGECLGEILSALLGPAQWRPVRKKMVDSWKQQASSAPSNE